MTLSPDPTELAARARADLRMGVPVVLSDASGAVLVAAAETLTRDRLSDLMGPQTVLALTGWRARTLKVTAYDGDLARIALPENTTAADVAALADPTADLKQPMKGPLKALRGGDTHLHRAAIALCKCARLLPAALVMPVTDAAGFARTHELTHLSADDLPAAALERIVSAHVPLSVSQDSRLHIFRSTDGSEEHHAIEIGRPDRGAPVLARLHSACFTGDLLGSLKCDCGPQLRSALAQMGAEGSGVLLYLDQEGRGIGLANKMRAYSLQDQGFDTVEANHRLGFEDDERDFRIGADILRSLGFDRVRLLTNNPAKIARMEENGIAVTERVPLIVGETAQNAAYLEIKRIKSGHLR